ncbi:hypothetical protein M8494_28755 [Serratia ureilytica]
MFRARLKSAARGAATWRYNDQGWELASQEFDVKAKSLWVNGDFRYQQPARRSVAEYLAGIRQATAPRPRAISQNRDGQASVDYLSGAIQGGSG